MVTLRGVLRKAVGATLCLQLLTVAVGTVNLCRNMPAAEEEAPPPSCPMHQQADSPDDASSGPHMRCRCSASLLSFLLPGVGVIPDRLELPAPESPASAVFALDATPLDSIVRPLAPPPKSSLL